eukprot:2393838-Prymnesium_polylepis.1
MAAYNCPVRTAMRRHGIQPRYAAVVPDGGRYRAREIVGRDAGHRGTDKQASGSRARTSRP